MMRLSVVSQTPQEVLLKVEGRIRLAEEAGLLAREGRHWLERGKRLVLDLAGLQAIGQAGLGVLQYWEREGRPVVLRRGSNSLRATLHFHGFSPEEDTLASPG